MKIRSPPNLHYPITVVELVKQRDEPITRSTLLFKYFYETLVPEQDKYGETKEAKKKFPAQFSSSVDGVISEWFIKPGTVIQRSGIDIAEIEEPCTHEIQFGGMCANCGKDMTEVDYLTEERNVDRATVNMTHDNLALLVSEKEAMRADEEAKTRLLEGKKLSLIVDLDQTVIHTTCERTIAEWQADPENPNYEFLTDVRGFPLVDDNAVQMGAVMYYVKPRPGLKDFFDRMSLIFEMHVYTMATRTYARNVCKIIDPERRYFGDRILSRDENYTDQKKNLQRLFPTNTDMAVVIDDRSDIWNYCDNLIRVPVFNFFPGAGDINASFLPKQQELIDTTPKVAPAQPQSLPKQKSTSEGESTKASISSKPGEIIASEAGNGVLTELEQQLISMGSADDPEVLEQQVKEQEQVIISQQTERPLLQQQLLLDKEDEEAETQDTEQASEVSNGNAHSSELPRHHRHAILNNDDRGLEIIEKHLMTVYKAFYDEYRAKRKPAPAGRLAELKGSPKKRLEEFVPDIKVLIPRIKRQVLDGTTVVFSGIIPLGADIRKADIALWIESFGTEVSETVNRHTTHLIANPERKTSKVKKAARYPNCKIVTPEWMIQCCTLWEHVDETPYLIEVDAVSRSGSPFEDLEDTDDGVTGDDDGRDDIADLHLDMSADKWQSLDDEFQDFMNESDDTDDNSVSDSESVRSDASVQTETRQKGKKRKRKTDSPSNSEAEDSDASVGSTSRLQRRKKRTMERVTSLTNVVSADKSSGLPSPETTGPEEEHGDDERDRDPAGLVADDSDPEADDDGLEAEMLAEFERSGSEDA